MKKHRIPLVLLGVVTLLFTSQISVTAADKVVVVPLFRNNQVQTVTSKTGRIWMDRNLGAYRAAESSNDYRAYGWLYQWGRLADGHELRSSSVFYGNSSQDNPGREEFFLIVDVDPWDWRIPQNDSLWQGVSGTNNPCPTGFRLPTENEWISEIDSWSTKDAAGGYASTLKLVLAGSRNGLTGVVVNAGVIGYYMSSTVDGYGARYLSISDGSYSFGNYSRARGHSVRRIKNQ